MEKDEGPETRGSNLLGQHVRISREKKKLAKSAEENFSTEIFRIAKVLERRPRPLYESEE